MLQTTYLGLSLVNDVNPVSSSLYYLRYMSGYNRLFENFNLTLSFVPPVSRRLLESVSTLATNDINVRLNALGYSGPHLIQNFNYMYILIISLLFVFGLVYLVGYLKEHDKAKNIGTYVTKNIVFMLLFFSVNNMGFSLGVHIKYLSSGQIWTASMYVSWVLALFTTLLLVGYLYYYIRNTVEFSDYTDKFLDDTLSRSHYVLFLSFRYVLNFVCGYFNDYSELCYALVTFEIIAFIYLVFRRPYKKLLFNILAWLNELSVCIILVIDMYFRVFSKANSNDSSILAAGWVQLALAVICVVANYFGIMVYVCQRCCKANKVHDWMGDKDNDPKEKK